MGDLDKCAESQLKTPFLHLICSIIIDIDLEIVLECMCGLRGFREG